MKFNSEILITVLNLNNIQQQQQVTHGKAGRSNSETFAEDQDMIKCLV